MPTLSINGKNVQVDDSFLTLSPEQQHVTVESIAKNMKVGQPPPQEPYSGSILPISKDAGGNIGFDSNAGIVGMLKRAVTLPGDVYTGKTPAIGSDGHTSPELVDRSAELAGIASPAPAAMRAGEMGVLGALAPQKVAPPSAQALKSAAGAGYDAARSSGLEFHSGSVGELGRSLQSALEQDGIIAELAPKTHAILGKIINPPEGSTASVANVEAIRRSLSHVTGDNPTDNMAAGRAIRGVDDFLGNFDPAAVVDRTAPAQGTGAVPYGAPIIDQGGIAGADPAAVAQTLRDARGNYAAAQRSNALTGDLDKANTGILERAENRAQATNSGRNLDNAIRQRVASLLERPRNVSGYSDAEMAALQAVVDGGPVRNTARNVGNLLGGGGGWGQAATGAAGAVAGGMAGGNTGIGIALGGLAPMTVGTFAKAIENSLARRSLGKADAMVRQNSPLYQNMQAQQPMAVPALDRNTAVLRALMELGAGGGTPQQNRRWGQLY